MLYLYYRTTFVPVRKYISLPLEINKHYMAIKRFGVSLEENLLESLDKYVDENGFANQDVILSSSQYYINQHFCLHIETVMGTAHRLTELADKLTAIKGIKHGKLVMSRAD